MGLSVTLGGGRDPAIRTGFQRGAEEGEENRDSHKFTPTPHVMLWPGGSCLLAGLLTALNKESCVSEEEEQIDLQ